MMPSDKKGVVFPKALAFYNTWLGRTETTLSALGRAVHPDAKNPAGNMAYWVKGYGQPNPYIKQRIADAMSVPVETIENLYDRKFKEMPPDWSGRSVVKRVAAMTPEAPREPLAAPVMSVTVLSNGRTRIKLDIELPTKEALALAQTLYSAHTLIGETHERRDRSIDTTDSYPEVLR